jgi:long-chain fatty acid transport protein
MDLPVSSPNRGAIRRAARLIVTSLVWLGLSGAAAANDGFFQNGYGAKTQGMGGAGIAFPQEALSIAGNPAAATMLGNTLEMDAELLKPFRSAMIRGNALGPDAEYSGDGLRRFVVPEFGITHQLGPKWAAGFAMYGNGGLNTKYGTNPFGRFGATGTAGVNLAQVLLSPTLAYRLAPGHSVGVSINLLYETFSAYGIGSFGVFSQDPAALSDRNSDYTFGAGVRLGYLGRLTSWLQIGAMWQSKTMVGSFDRYKGLFANGGNLDLPAAYGAGIDVTPLRGLDVAIDVTRIDYHGVNAIGDSFDSIFSGNKLGAPNGPGFDWKNCTAVKLGINWHATDRLQLRVGYNHSSATDPAYETFPNILSPNTTEHQYTAGATWTISPKWEVSVMGFYAPAVILYGTPNAIPAAFGGGTVDLKSSVLAVGGGVAYRFR